MHPSAAPKRKRNRRPLACEPCRLRKVKCEYGDNTRCARCLLLDMACSGRQLGANGMEKTSETSKLVKQLEQTVHQMESVLVRMGSRHANSSSSRLGLDGLGWSGTGAPTIFYEAFPPGQSSELAFLDQVLDIRNMSIQDSKARPPISFDCVYTSAGAREANCELAPKQLSFPEPDLLQNLIDLYFNHANNFFWLLHRPTFEKSLAKNLHLEDHSFGEVVLLVIALGSQHSSDPRVLLDSNNQNNWASSGWKWFSQVQMLSKSFFKPPTLYELQKYCLASLFCSSGTSHVAWALAGIGLRLAQGIGVHHLKKRGYAWTIEAELWKRAFWNLLCMDRLTCSAHGRPCFTHEEQYEVELPVIADEEYWDNADPKQAFKQPDGKPSKQACFVALIQLSEILAFTHRTVYATGKFKAFLAKSNPNWREEITGKIDAALDNWRASIPKHLQWPVHPVESGFYYQSAGLYFAYYLTQIQAHWPFIPSMIGLSSLSLSSLVTCANAARSCSHLFKAFGNCPAPVLQPYHAPKAIICGMVLLLYIWEGKKFDLAVDSAKELGNVQHCLDYLKLLKPRFALEMERGSVELIERLVVQELSTLDATNHPLQLIDMPVLCSPSPMLSNPGPAPLELQPITQLSDDWDEMFRVFMNDGLTRDGYRGLDDVMAQDLGSEDNFFSSILTTFNATVPPHLSPIPETKF